MATATVTGSLKDLGLVSMGDRVPELVFEIDEELVIVGSSTLIPAEPVKAIPASNGSFTVDLQESLGTNPYSPYKLTINWSSSGIPRTVSPSWRVVVPAGGGAIGDMLAVATPSQIILKGAPGDAEPLTIVQAVAASAGRATVSNPLPNSAPSTASPAWTAGYGTSGAGALTFVTDTNAPSGKAYVRATWTTSATSANANIKSVAGPAAAGKYYAGTISARSSIATVLGATVYFYDAGGTQIGATYYNRLSRAAANTWITLEVNGALAPAGTVTARVGVATNSAQSTIPTAGATLDACAVGLFEGDIVYTWFDGDTVNAYWSGLENASTSYKAVTGDPFAAPYTNAPAAAGTHTGRYSTNYRLYLPPGADIGPTRRKIAQALAGTNTYRLAFMGHSIIAGQGGTPGIIDDPRLFQQRAAQAGKAVPGMVTAFNNTTRDARVTVDPAWTNTGAPRDNMQLHMSTTTAGKSITWAFDHAGTVVDVFTFGNGSAVTYSIDGAAAVTITPSGSAAVQTTTVSGLANTTHTVTVTSTTTTAAYVLGVALRNTTGLEVANLGYSGSIANDWRPLALGGGATFYNGYNNVVTNWKADGVVIELGANEIIWDVGSASLSTNLGLIIAALQAAGKDVVLVADPPVYSSTKTTWFTDFYPTLYTVADTYKVPLIDLSAHWISKPIGDARGLYFDQWHPNNAGYFDLHSVFTKALLP